MLPAGAFAVVLILGGAQIMLPAPAFVEQGRVWAPAREVLQRLGYHVRWQAEPRALVATRDEQSITFPEVPPPWPVPTTPSEARYTRRQGAVLYVPLLALRELGLRATWEPATRRVIIRDPPPLGPPLAAILNDPTQWLGRQVVLTGDYAGWDRYGFCYATRAGPPVATGDWVLRSEGGAIYCTPDLEAPAPTPVPTGLASRRPTALLLTPYAALGQRVRVTGTVALAPSGVPFLRHGTVEPVAGREGASCVLVLNAVTRRPGDKLSWEVVIRNPGPGNLPLSGDASVAVSIATPGGQILMIKQSSVMKTLPQALAADAELRLPGAWNVPTDAPAGTYSLTASVAAGLQTYAEHFLVVSLRDGPTP
jgi:hypothetical protein